MKEFVREVDHRKHAWGKEKWKAKKDEKPIKGVHFSWYGRLEAQPLSGISEEMQNLFENYEAGHLSSGLYPLEAEGCPQGHYDNQPPKWPQWPLPLIFMFLRGPIPNWTGITTMILQKWQCVISESQSQKAMQLLPVLLDCTSARSQQPLCCEDTQSALWRLHMGRNWRVLPITGTNLSAMRVSHLGSRSSSLCWG